MREERERYRCEVLSCLRNTMKEKRRRKKIKAKEGKEAKIKERERETGGEEKRKRRAGERARASDMYVKGMGIVMRMLKTGKNLEEKGREAGEGDRDREAETTRRGKRERG